MDVHDDVSAVAICRAFVALHEGKSNQEGTQL